jgi:hypothetical protein
MKDMTTVVRWCRASRIAAIIVPLLSALRPQRLASPAAAAGPTVVTGSLGGTAYKIEMPAAWNGTLILFSHGYIAPGAPNPALALDPVVGAWLLAHDYAVAGSSYSRTGWAVAEALHDQMALLALIGGSSGVRGGRSRGANPLAA